MSLLMSVFVSTVFAVPFGVLFAVDMSSIVGIIIFIIILVARVMAGNRQEAETQLQEKNKKRREPQNDMSFSNSGLSDEQEVVFVTKPSEQKKRRNLRKPQPYLQNEIVDNTESSRKDKRKSLTRELPQQGQGSRFEAAPGTLTSIQLTPQVEAKVKPELDSLTGIYDPKEQDDNAAKQLQINLIELLTTPEGIRNSIILSEILNRPNFLAQDSPISKTATR
jgi:FtsZ-interacting cell division protein ZipA